MIPISSPELKHLFHRLSLDKQEQNLNLHHGSLGNSWLGHLSGHRW